MISSFLPENSTQSNIYQQPNQSYYGYPNLNQNTQTTLPQPITQLYNTIEPQPQSQPQSSLYPSINQYQPHQSISPQPQQQPNIANESINQQQQQVQQGQQNISNPNNPTNIINSNNEIKETFDKNKEIQKLFEASLVSVKNSVQKAEGLGSPMPSTRKVDPQQNYNDFASISSMSLEKFIPFPSEITQRLHSTASVSALFGIFPELNRVWISIDNILFLWSYATNKFKYVHFSHVINNAYLMSPKKNVFTEGVSRMVVICTYAEIFLNPIRDDEECEIQLGLSIPTDSIKITAIIGTKDGRIYFAGDGHIYEIEYSRNSFSYYRNEPIRKVNRTAGFLSSLWNRKRPDIIQLQYCDTKNYLYALTIDSKLIIYSIKDGTFTEVCQFDPCKDYLSEPRVQQQQQQQQQQQNQILQQQNQQQQQFGNQFGNQFTGQNAYQQQQQIQLQQQQQQVQQQQAQQRANKVSAISIHLTPDDERFSDVLVVLNNGVRLYYQSANSNISANNSQYQLFRIPPNSMVLSNSLSNTIHQAFYSKGIFITSTEIEESTDRVTGVSLFNLSQIKKIFDQTPSQTQDNPDHFCEKPNFININGRVIDIKEEVNLSLSSLNLPYYKDLIIEHSITPRRFLLLSASGISIITKLRYTDIFQNLLANSKMQEIDYLYGELGLVISNSLMIELYCLSPKSTIISNEIQLYGNISIPKIVNSRVSDSALLYIKKFSGSPSCQQLQQNANTDLGFAVNNAQYQNSSIYLGLMAYTGRVMSMFWNQPLLLSNGSCKWSLNQLRIYQSHLLSLLTFMETMALAPTISITSNEIDLPLEGDKIQTVQDAKIRERRALIGLRELFLQSIQVLNLFIIFQEDNNTKPDFQSIIRNQLAPTFHVNQYTFSNYVDDQHKVISQLIDGFLKRLVDFNYKVDGFSNRLTQECPGFYKQEHKEFQRVKQYLAEASKGLNYQNSIQAAIEILLAISPNYDFIFIIKSLIELDQIPQITPLLLQYISRLESQQLQPKLETTSSSSSKYIENDEIKTKKSKIYNQIVNLLDVIYNQSIQNSSISFLGEQVISEIISLTLSFIGNKQSGYNFETDINALKAIYEWILKKNGISKIMDLDYSQSPMLVDYLKTHHRELSWKYLQRNKKYLEASDVLFQIAEGSNDLDTKIKCYTDAQMILNETNQDSIQYQDSKFLYFLATTQKSIVSEINSKGEAIENDLKQDLLDLNQLFEISKKHLLHEQMLLIANYGHHDDANFFKLLWKIILENVVSKYKNERVTNGDFDNLASQLLDKIIKYGIQLKYPNETSFPVQYIINCTEQMFFKCYIDQHHKNQDLGVIRPDIQYYDWLARALHNSVAIDYWVLVDIYKSIIESNSPNDLWNSDEALIYIISVFVSLLESLINSTSSSFSERRVFASKQFRSIISNFQDKLKKVPKDDRDLISLTLKIDRIKPILLTLENSY